VGICQGGPSAALTPHTPATQGKAFKFLTTSTWMRMRSTTVFIPRTWVPEYASGRGAEAAAMGSVNPVALMNFGSVNVGFPRALQSFQCAKFVRFCKFICVCLCSAQKSHLLALRTIFFRFHSVSANVSMSNLQSNHSGLSRPVEIHRILQTN